MAETQKEEKLDRSELVAAAGISHDPLDLRVEPGKKIPAKIPDNEVRSLVNQGAIVTKDEYAELEESKED